MNGFTHVTAMGTLTRDPESRAAGSASVTAFSIAVNKKVKDEDRVYFFNCEAWGKTGENIQKFFSKGKPIIVLGELQVDTWEKDGKKNSATKISVNNFHFVPDGRKADGPDSRPASIATVPKSASKPGAKPPVKEIEADDIPF